MPNGMEQDSRRVGKARRAGVTPPGPPHQTRKKRRFAAGSRAAGGCQGAAMRGHGRAMAKHPRSSAGSRGKARASRSPAPKIYLVQRVSCNLQRRGRRKEEGKRLTVSYTLRGKTQHFPGHQEAAGIYYKLIFYRTPSSGKTAGVVKFAGCFPSLCELACLQLLRVS